MASDHDRELVARIEAGSVAGVLDADDPAEVAEAVIRTTGAVRVDVDALPGAIAGARVRLAELVVARARQADATDHTPAVRAAEAHLRRQQAAWKVGWWEQAEPVPDLGSWAPGLVSRVPLTLVAVDRASEVDPGSHATMTATVPAAVRVVVLQARV